jgi:hypothetical protein
MQNSGLVLPLGNPCPADLAIMSSALERAITMDVYLNTKRELLVVKKGCSVPAAAVAGGWRKSHKRVVRVSAAIRSAIQKDGYYMRKVTDFHANDRAAASASVESLQHHN